MISSISDSFSMIVSRASIPRQQQLRRSILLLGLFLIGVGGADSEGATVVGRMAGDFAVSATGSATYRMPIAVAAGQNEMKPNISLSYSSDRGDGLAGVGWTISGLSQITRCGLTPVLDGKFQGVRFNQQDRYCLDGKPLIQISAGNYWSSGQEYRTEVHNYEKITSVGSIGTGVGSGPQYFEVQHRNGLTYRYGFNPDSRVTAAGNPDGAIKTWALAEIGDTYNTRVLFTYQANSVTGEFRPDKIYWSVRSGENKNQARYKLTFLYQDRPNTAKRSGYTWGSVWKRQKRLQFIDYEFNDSAGFQRVHRYSLNYGVLTDGSGRSVLESVQQCGNKDCLAPTIFDSNTAIKGWQADITPVKRMNGYAIEDVLSGDFNGDGRQDFFIPSAGWKVLLGTWDSVSGSETSDLASSLSTGMSASTPGLTRVIDFNGDGLSDLLTPDVAGNNWYVYLSNGTTMSAVDTGISRNEFAVPTVVDFNGDGLGDILYKTNTSRIYVRINNGNGFDAAMQVRSNFEGMGPTLSYPGSAPDFDGDGRDDYFEHKICYGDGCFPGYYMRIYSAGATSLNYRGEFLMGTAGSGPDRVDNVHVSSIRAVDVNGDGLSDLMYLARTSGSGWTWYTAISQGKRFSAPVNTMIPYPDQPWLISIVNEMPYTVADYDMDGRADLIVGSTGSGAGLTVYLSDGTTFDSTGIPLSGVTPPGGSVVFAADIGGTGYQSLVYEDEQFNWVILGHTGENGTPKGPDTLLRVTDGLENYFTINSRPVSRVVSYPGSVTAPDEREVHDGAFYVVDNYASNDGTASGTYKISYAYADPGRNMNGRGFLGFKTVESTDSRDNTYTFSTYRQDFPYTGQVDQVVRYQSDGKKITGFDAAWSHYKQTSLDGDYYFVHLMQAPATSSVTTEYEVDPDGGSNGQLMRTTMRKVQYDFVHGGISQDIAIISSPNDAAVFTSTTNTTFEAFSGSVYCLGFPKEIGITKSDSVELAQTRSVQYTYNSQCQRSTETVGPVNDASQQLVTTYGVDAEGKVTSIVRGSGAGSVADRMITIGWDLIGGYRQLSETAQVSGETNLTVRHTWDYGLGLEASRTDPRGQTTSWHYDDFGRLELEERPGPATTRITIESCAGCFPATSKYKVRSLRSDGFWSDSYHDSYGRIVGQVSVVLADATSAEARRYINYDSLGRITWKAQPSLTASNPFGSGYQYDLRGRIKSENRSHWDPNYSARTTWTYDRLNVTVVPPDASVTIYVNDIIGRLIEIKAPLNSNTQNTYWPFGELKNISQDGAVIKSMTYDARGFPNTVTDIDSGTWSYGYSVFGELLSQTDDVSPTANTITMVYDQLGRPRQRTEAEGTTDWDYHQSGNGLGLLDEVTGPMPNAGHSTGSCTQNMGYCEKYTYEPQGRLKQTEHKFNGASHVTNYAYNNNGQIASITYPAMLYQNRYTFLYSYAYGHLNTIAKSLGNGNKQTVYDVVNQDAFGNAELVKLFGTFGAGITEYDHQRLYYGTSGHIRSIKTGASPLGTSVQNHSYRWNKGNNLIVRQDNNQANQSEWFIYDSLQRLDKIFLNTVETMDMDYYPNGNIRSKPDVGTYNYAGPAGSHAVTSVTNGPRLNNYHYDANGNMDCRGGSSSACTSGDSITWTSFNKPQQINYGDNSSRFDYGPDRHRILQVSSTGSSWRNTWYVGNHFEFYVEKGNRTKWQANIYANGQVVYQLIEHQKTGACSSQQGSQGYFVLRDHQNSIDVLLNDGTSNDSKYSYDAFGKRRNVNGWENDTDDSLLSINRTIRRGYTGHEHLDNVRLIHMNGRLQDPVLGRMISPDPGFGNIRNPQSLNAYSYVMNNPLSLLDPSGFVPVCAIGAECPALKGKDIEALPEDTGLAFAFDSDGNLVAILANPDSFGGGLPTDIGNNSAATLFSTLSTGTMDPGRITAISAAIRSAPGRDELIATIKRPSQKNRGLEFDSTQVRQNITGIGGFEGGTDLFIGVFGVSGSTGVVMDADGASCAFHQECFQVGLGGYAGITGQGVAGFGGPLKDGTIKTFGVFAVGGFGGGGFGTLDVNSGNLTLGGGFSEGLGGAGGIQVCTTTYLGCQ